MESCEDAEETWTSRVTAAAQHSLGAIPLATQREITPTVTVSPSGMHELLDVVVELSVVDSLGAFVQSQKDLQAVYERADWAREHLVSVRRSVGLSCERYLESIPSCSSQVAL